MSNASSGTAGTGWAVTSQQEATDVSDSGMVAQGMRVYFRTQHGATGSIFVPRDAYTIDRVRQLVSDQAATMDSVHGLQG